MHHKIWSTLLFTTFFISKTIFAGILIGENGSLSGKITDATTGEPLVGVSVYLPDMKIGATTAPDGTFSLSNLPKRMVTVQVSYLGYKQLVEKIDLRLLNKKDFALQPSVTEVNEVVITGSAQSVEQNRVSTPIEVVGHEELLQISSTNIIAALANQPGISQVTTGVGISKPVIRGLGYNRVVVVNDSIRQEGQQWGDEHGIEVDEFSVNKVEILKGPASLTYGSDAMAGVINMMSAPTLSDGQKVVNLLADYQTNNGLVSLSGNFMGNRHGLIWDVRASQKRAHAYQNKYDGYVFNSNFREKTVSGIVGFNRSWGYTHLHFSAYNLRPGIIEGARDSVTGRFLKPIALDGSHESSQIATDSDFKTYTPSTPFQKIYHYKMVSNNSFVIGESTLKATIGFQQNRRQEFSNVLSPDEFGLFFLLNTLNYSVQFNFPEKRKFNFSVGTNGMKQVSKNKGIEFLVPEYALFDIGFFAVGKKEIGPFDLSGGLRFDTRSEQTKNLFLNQNGEKVDGPGVGVSQRFVGFDSKFVGSSGSLGATCQFSPVFYGKLNLSHGFRAPSIGEIGANGLHDGTTRYEIGNPNLKPESSWEGDFALGIKSEHLTAELDLFDNHIQNFIFSRKLTTADGQDSISEGYQTFQFVAGDAHLLGGECRIDLHPHPFDWLHFENAFSFVQATQRNQPDSTKYLPFTPAPKFSTELRVNAKKWGKKLENAYARVRLDHYFAQNQFFSAFGTETKTPRFSLLEVGFGTDFVSKNRKICSVFFSVQNLTDVAYQSHLSRLKYEAENLKTGRMGVFEMGRNVSLKLLMPFNF